MENQKKNIAYYLLLTLLFAGLVFRNSLILGTLLILCRPIFFLLLCYYFFRKKEFKVLTLVFFALFSSEYLYIQLQKHRQDDFISDNPKQIKILTHNLLYISDPNSSQLDSILKLNPDLILLQELNPKWDAFFRKKLKNKYPYQYSRAQTNAYGLGVFSKLPIDTIDYFAEYQGIPYCQKISFHQKEKKIQIYNTHFDSPAIAIYGQGPFLELLETSHTRRKMEYNTILSDSKKYDGVSTIFCGDLNTIRIEPLYRDFKNSWLTTSEVRKNSSLSFRTKKYGPILSLDHVFYKGNLECVYSEVHPFGNSDHLPVFSVFNY